MNLKEYQNLAKTTLAHLSIPELDHAHMALGIGGELLELQEEIFIYDANPESSIDNLIKELGDLCWYPVCYSFLLGKEIEYLQHEDLLITVCKDIIEITKKHIAYEKELVVFNSLCKLMYSLKSFASEYEIDFGLVLETNINKLKARFPDGFNKSTAQALTFTADE